MGQTNRERVKEWREKKSKEGGRSLSVWLAPETARRLDEIREAAGESTSLLVARAIAAFHDITCNDRGASSAPPSVPSPSKEKPGQSRESVAPVTSPREDTGAGEATVTCNDKGRAATGSIIAVTDDSITAIMETFRNKRDFSAISERLAALLRLRIEKGEPFSTLMGELNEVGLPPPGGEGPWRRGTIYALLR